ncbi:MAG: leucyl aminopeptidase [Sandaracinaceae bacterium]|nr:leucyl aminopeptidase [Sandaracinaceae bacterium]
MDVYFVPADLRRLDALKSEALCIPFFEDERPLCGALGLVDWRMCGHISALIRKGRLNGSAEEVLLIPARPRLPFEKLILFGLGPKHAFTEESFAQCVERMLQTLTKSRVRASVIVLPGRALGRIAPARAMEIFLAIASSHAEHDKVTLVDDAEAERAMQPIVERERRRARAFVA